MLLATYKDQLQTKELQNLESHDQALATSSSSLAISLSTPQV